MKPLHTLIGLFFLSLQDRSTAQSITYIGTTGGQITVKCSESFQTSQKTFCKDPCNRNILIQTTDVRAHSGRYSIKYEGGHFSVSITELIKSDSGRYRCGVSSAPYVEFGITVVDALLEGDYDPAGRPIYTRTGGDLTVACSFTLSGSWKLFCKGQCDGEDALVRTEADSATSDRYSIEYTRASGRGVVLFVTITQLRQSDSGWYSCALDRNVLPASSWEFNVIVTDGFFCTAGSGFYVSMAPHEIPGPLSTSVPSTSTAVKEQQHTDGDVLLTVVLVLVIVIILSSLAVLIVWIRRRPRPCGLTTRGNPDGTNMQIDSLDYENQPPVSTGEESTYLSLDPASRDQIYSTLTQTKHA
ncbi:polymeric immunoglobulin receptor-like isoform X1 [Mastacembelus armatus]|uniref:polymeric immunoglobulin receptor-like isoform X1 n=1 Tax=Mastacembelus armatus TaxID=205130 RepID=UPI000E4552CC|nr:polymeric immunoglobulin receptor-like isoform X1 [Mastacembelus armatus]